MPSPLRAAWDDPRPPQPRTSTEASIAVVGVLVALTVIEGTTRAELAGQPLAVAGTAAVTLTVGFRRTHPLAALIAAFAGLWAVELLTGAPEMYVTAFMLALAYAVVRWGSGREALLGTGVLAVHVLGGALLRGMPVSDAFGGLAVVGIALALGTAMRLRGRARQRAMEQVRLLEREQLARDLHDTVAHHVSAIAIRAQAGLAVAPQRPEAATEALAVIEAEAKRTLTEMRTIVRALRADGGEADPVDAPQRTLADVAALADDGGPGPAVRVAIEGDTDAADVAPAVGAAVVRIAQEAVTNARRHARGARTVDVVVGVTAHEVRLDVTDDGAPPARASGDGYGLAGMRERAALLGGTCEAGPAPDGGWAVAAVLPRTGPTGPAA